MSHEMITTGIEQQIIHEEAGLVHNTPPFIEYYHALPSEAAGHLPIFLAGIPANEYSTIQAGRLMNPFFDRNAGLGASGLELMCHDAGMEREEAATYIADLTLRSLDGLVKADPHGVEVRTRMLSLLEGNVFAMDSRTIRAFQELHIMLAAMEARTLPLTHGTDHSLHKTVEGMLEQQPIAINYKIEEGELTQTYKMPLPSVSFQPLPLAENDLCRKQKEGFSIAAKLGKVEHPLPRFLLSLVGRDYQMNYFYSRNTWYQK